MNLQTSAGTITTNVVVTTSIYDELISVRVLTKPDRAIIFTHKHVGITTAYKLQYFEPNDLNNIAVLKNDG